VGRIPAIDTCLPARYITALFFSNAALNLTETIGGFVIHGFKKTLKNIKKSLTKVALWCILNEHQKGGHDEKIEEEKAISSVYM